MLIVGDVRESDICTVKKLAKFLGNIVASASIIDMLNLKRFQPVLLKAFTRLSVPLRFKPLI